MIAATGVTKTFVLHLRGGATLPVLRDVDLHVAPGECVALAGPSGTGKSTLLKCLYGTYRADSGTIALDGTDITRADDRAVLALRTATIGFVTQFLRVIPRVPAHAIVAEAFAASGLPPADAALAATDMLARVKLPDALHALPPATFSGGEQQRLNLARGLAGGHKILLLDEPTAALDPGNTANVVALIRDARARGVALAGIFHDTAVRDAVADRTQTLRAAG